MLGEIVSTSVWSVIGKVLSIICALFIAFSSYQYVRIHHLEKQVDELTKDIETCRDDQSWLIQSNAAMEEQYLFLEKHFANLKDICKNLLQNSEITDERIKNLFKDPPGSGNKR